MNYYYYEATQNSKCAQCIRPMAWCYSIKKVFPFSIHSVFFPRIACQNSTWISRMNSMNNFFPFFPRIFMNIYTNGCEFNIETTCKLLKLNWNADQMINSIHEEEGEEKVQRIKDGAGTRIHVHFWIYFVVAHVLVKERMKVLIELLQTLSVFNFLFSFGSFFFLLLEWISNSIRMDPNGMGPHEVDSDWSAKHNCYLFAKGSI